MADPFSIPVKILSNPPGMSEYAKALFSASVGFFVAVAAEPLRLILQNWYRVREATTILHKFTVEQVGELCEAKIGLLELLKQFPPFPRADPEKTPIREADQRALARHERYLPDKMQSDVFWHYYQGDKALYYAIPHASAIRLFFESLETFQRTQIGNHREEAARRCYDMQRTLYDLVKEVRPAKTKKKSVTFAKLEPLIERCLIYPPRLYSLSETTKWGILGAIPTELGLSEDFSP